MSAVQAKSGANSDRGIVLVVGGVMIAILVGVSLIAKSSEDTDPRPSTNNSGSAGARVAFLTLKEMGKPVLQWEKPLAALYSVDAEHTTLVLAEPQLLVGQRHTEGDEVKKFLERGGRVLLTGAGWTSLLPGGSARVGPPLSGRLCETTPEGPGPMGAGAGQVEINDDGGWIAKGPQFRVQQRCGSDPVVVAFSVGKGEAVWWSSSMPMSNAGLRTDADLKLLLASLYGGDGEAREVLFDEYVQSLHGMDEHLLKGLPIFALFLQFVAAFALLVWSFSRRTGPLRRPVAVPRTSPVEFAESMGDLYAKAGATDAATEAGRRRMVQLLHRDAGVSRATLQEGPDAVAESLGARMPGDWSELARHLREADEAAGEPVRARSALKLVQAMAKDEVQVREALRPAVVVKVLDGEV